MRSDMAMHEPYTRVVSLESDNDVAQRGQENHITPWGVVEL